MERVAWIELEGALEVGALRRPGAECLVLAGGFDAGVPDAVIERLLDLDQPVIAVVEGSAVGAGLGLALAADLRVAGPAARFAARCPGAGVAWLLTLSVGRARAASMLLASAELDARAAVAAGLVHAVADDPRAHAAELAAALVARGPAASAAAKRALRRAGELTLRESLQYERSLHEMAVGR